MTKFLIPLVAGFAFVVATPAAAQYYQQGYGYNNYGQARSLQVRIDNVQRQIHMLDRRNMIGDQRGDRLRNEANDIERRLHRMGRNGLNPYEANQVNARIARLEQRVQYAMANRYGGYGRTNGQYADRDRDGRNDRFEDDHGTRHDYR